MSQTDSPDPVGSVAEEAAKLLGALRGWAREHGDGIAATTDSVGQQVHEHLATGAPECAWCPVCRTITAVRQTRPEVRAHLASAASSLMLALSELMATHPPKRERGFQRIDLDDPDGRPESGT